VARDGRTRVRRVRGSRSETRWELRVTELIRNDGESWQRVHRHADPLVDGHGFDQILALLD
jgi:hypothetical protein